MKGKATIDIFNNNNDGKENVNIGVFFNPNGQKYTNSDGTISKSGLLVTIVNANIYTRE
ncbi:hypothetical protein [Campylobacter sp. LR286c]|uniref:hypothetical protein n=1 Tax=Campylobacter sp. LR286c TaxID=2593545 RepID=UPI00167FE8DB|nr:hypothetical protein [Campylobacter sp. LR286c]